MTNAHAILNTCDRTGPSLAGRLPAAIESLRAAVIGSAMRLFATFQYRRTVNRFARFSDHRLHDIGFERDWDGSILPVNRGA
jgi:uncharacterized protein YjiS (DUF1127 family)